jgi:hypothetical protein
MNSEPIIPDSVIFDRAPVLKRALRGLPDAMLAAMIEGIERHPDELVPGRLYRSREGGGCPVGVMLRVLRAGRDPGRVRFWLRDRWIQGIDCDRDLARRYPRLRHIELAFDTTVERTRHYHPHLSERLAARAAGLWFSAEAQAELDRRRRQEYERKAMSLPRVSERIRSPRLAEDPWTAEESQCSAY